MQPKDLRREEREQIPLEEIAKWKRKVQEDAPWFLRGAIPRICNPQTRSGKRSPVRRWIEEVYL